MLASTELLSFVQIGKDLFCQSNRLPKLFTIQGKLEAHTRYQCYKQDNIYTTL